MCVCVCVCVFTLSARAVKNTDTIPPPNELAQSAGAVEYTECIFLRSKAPTHNECLETICLDLVWLQ